MVRKAGAERPMTVRELSPAFDTWPDEWMRLKEDLEYGKKLLPYMEAFLNELIKKGLSRKTMKSHINNTWLLGGSIIRQVSMYEEYKTAPLKKLVESVETGGMLLDGFDSAQSRDFRATSSPVLSLN